MVVLDFIYGLLVIYSILWSLTFAHEAGHLLAARLLGLPILEFRVGKEYQVLTWVWQGVRVRFCVNPMAGLVRIQHLSARYWVNMIFVLAGPVAELLFLGALLWVGAVDVWTALFLIGVGIWFQRPRKLEGGVLTDVDLAIRMTRKRFRTRSFT